jgi:hypothetical protein
VSAVEYRPRTGILSAPAPVMDRLLGTLEGGAVPEDLEGTGAAAGGRLHPNLARALRPIDVPACRIGLERGRRRGAGWVDRERASFVVPLPDGRVRLRSVPAEFVPEALARLNELGPRPRVEPAVALRLPAAELGRLLAGTRPPGDAEPALAAIVEGLQEHWRVVATWRAVSGADEARAVEVIDTQAGLWLVTPADDTVELFPTTPSTVFLLLAALMPDEPPMLRI